MWNYFLTSLALMLVLEGIFPFLSPKRWRLTFLQLIRQRDRVLRSMGLFSMLAGTIIMVLVHAGTFFN